jgi:transcription termination factor NusA
VNDDSNSREEIISSFMRGASATLDEAAILFDVGFTTIEEIAYVPFDELRRALQSTDARANELRSNARKTLL